MNFSNPWCRRVFTALCFLPFCVAHSADDLPVLLKEDFKRGFARWDTTDDNAWRVREFGKPGNPVLELFGASKFKPPHRSPVNMALLKYNTVGDFVLTARVRTTKKSYGHRDMCLFFGYQDPAHFYYVHLGQKTDDHANQVFIVNNAPRIKVSEKTNAGTPWKDDTWHQVKIVREVKSGLVEVYFDDMKTPMMVAHDKTFDWGRIGLGSFDDTGMWDDVELRGIKVKVKAKGVAGQFRKETKKEVEIRDANNLTIKVPVDQIVERTPVISTMPPMIALLKKDEIRDVVAWLATLKAK